MGITNDLEKIGFNSTESRVYIAVLELGGSSVLQIAKKAGLPRSTVHDILRALNHRGLVSTYPKKKRMFFGPTDPALLVEQTKRQGLLVENLLPRLQALYELPKRNSQIRFYQGSEGLKIVVEEICRETKNVLAMSSVGDTTFFSQKEKAMFLELRKKHGVNIRTILRAGPEASALSMQDGVELRQSKIIEDILPYKGTILLWNAKFALIELGEESIVLIVENEQMTKMVQTLFEFTWRYAPSVSEHN